MHVNSCISLTLVYRERYPIKAARLVTVAMVKNTKALSLSLDPLRAMDKILARAANTPPIA